MERLGKSSAHPLQLRRWKNASCDFSPNLTGSSDLPAAISRMEQLRRGMRQWPPITSNHEKYQKGLKGIMDEEMGWVD